MDQNSYTGRIIPTVDLFNCSPRAYALLFCLWWGSRHKNSITPADLEYALDPPEWNVSDEKINQIRADICEAYPEYAGENGTDVNNVVRTIVKTLIDSDLPPLESVSFTFEVDNCTVAFREQLVRGRQSGYWTQTSRTMDLQYMDVNRNRSVSLLGGDEAVKIYDDTVETIREAYKRLQELGVPSEDIRLQPSAQVHRVYWMTDLRILLKTLKKRVDWIAQSSLWSPVISGILQKLSNSVDEELLLMIKDKVGKPAVTLSNEGYLRVIAHHYDIENMDRYVGKDPQPVDPLWLAYKGICMPEGTDLEFYDYMKSMYINTWSPEYLKVLQWRKEDPSYIGPYDRPYSWYEEHDALYMIEGLNKSL